MHGADVENLRRKLRQLHGFDPREEQIQAIKTLAIDREDLILIARTGWGKSLALVGNNKVGKATAIYDVEGDKASICVLNKDSQQWEDQPHLRRRKIGDPFYSNL